MESMASREDAQRGAFMESMASREDGLASLCTGYPLILTHAENTLSLSNW